MRQALFLLLFQAALSSCRGHGPYPADTVAVVQDVPITAAEVQVMGRILDWEAADSLAPRLPYGRSTALARLIDQILVAEAAAGRRIVASERDLEAARSRFGARVDSGGTPVPEAVSTLLLRRELTAARYWKATVTDLIRVSELDLDRYHTEHPDVAPGPGGPENYGRLRASLEPTLVRLHEAAAVAARLERLRRKGRIEVLEAGRSLSP